MATSGQGQAVSPKLATGIYGFDTMTTGGLPAGRISVIGGGAGTGKTLFALQALSSWAGRKGNTGVFVSFEEKPENVRSNFAAFEWGDAKLAGESMLLVDGRWRVDTLQSGDFDISGLLAAVEGVVNERGARLLVLDGIDAQLAMLPNPRDARRELMRLQHWSENLGLTTLITLKSAGLQNSDESNGGTENFFETIASYMADCVVQLERQSHAGIVSRTLHVSKYRGSAHVQNKVPYVIGSRGFEVEPATTDSGGFRVYSRRLSTGIADLDEMLGGGIFRGSTTLFTGAPGTAKTTIASKIAEAACQRNQRVLYVCFDESPEEIARNLASVNIDLGSHVEAGRLLMQGFLTRSYGVDLLVSRVRDLLESFRPSVLVMDPVSALTLIGAEDVGYSAARLIIHQCKHSGITTVLNSLLGHVDEKVEHSKAHISTLADNWLHLSYVISAGERNRALTIVKSRGTSHSNQVRELVISDQGLRLEPVYTEEGEVLMGAMRWQREEHTRREQHRERMRTESRYRETSREVEEIAHQISSLQRTLEEKRLDLSELRDDEQEESHLEERRRKGLADIRQASRKAGAGSGSGRTTARRRSTPREE